MNWTTIQATGYRPEIDGVRAIAVVAVILFHMGYLPNGYLGVDVFFVISGYLITGIIYKKRKTASFSIKEFYLRRFRRITPLVLVVTTVALLVGGFVMLPDDLENLAQSVVATTLFSNNILSYITIFDYWDITNEFKPLMHTWSLGIEEQYYLFYPLIIMLIPVKRKKLLVTLLSVLALLSFSLYLFESGAATRFYLLQYRFFELAIGGIFAIILDSKIVELKYRWLVWLVMLFILVVPPAIFPVEVALSAVVLLTTIILTTIGVESRINPVISSSGFVFIGKISFSLYMWHQVYLAYYRYTYSDELSLWSSMVLGGLILATSILSYNFVEEPFRRGFLPNRTFMVGIVGISLALLLPSLLLYSKAGIIRDVPELSIIYGGSENVHHNSYNDRIYKLANEFDSTNTIKVLLIGNSFARDYGNILLETKFSDQMDLSYAYSWSDLDDDNRIENSDVILAFPLTASVYEKNKERQYLNVDKLYCIGNKSFGTNSGLYYNYRGDDKCEQLARIREDAITYNQVQSAFWGPKFLDVLRYIRVDSAFVPVFTEECKFFSQDTKHLTYDGAKELAKYISADPKHQLNRIFTSYGANRE